MKVILIVDDDPGILETLSHLINENTEYKTVVAEDGEVALDIITNMPPDLILMDMMMPRIGGMALLSQLKSSKSTKHIPIICISGEMTHETFIREGKALGADDYLIKPLDSVYLLDKINALLNKE